MNATQKTSCLNLYNSESFFSVGLHITGNTSTHECKLYRANQVGVEVSVFYKLADVSEDKIYIVDKKVDSHFNCSVSLHFGTVAIELIC